MDTLREPWVENELNGGGQEAAAGAGASDARGGPPELAWRREFDTVPSNGKAVFGGLQVNKIRLSGLTMSRRGCGGRALCKKGGKELAALSSGPWDVSVEDYYRLLLTMQKT